MKLRRLMEGEGDREAAGENTSTPDNLKSISSEAKYVRGSPLRKSVLPLLERLGSSGLFVCGELGEEEPGVDAGEEESFRTIMGVSPLR